jgi:N-acyl-D-aspartate/D-glutamate deacylase
MGKTTVIKNGLVVDGTGNPGFLADVLIEGDRVIEIGSNLQGDVVIDASGRVVAPGFIDIHTHYDAQAFWDPALTPSCYHGVTTVVAGNCGFSIAPTRPQDRALIANTMEKVEDMDPATLNAGIPWDFESFPEYLASIEQHGTLLNFAAYVGHTPLRIFVMGDQSVGRAATPTEISSMTKDTISLPRAFSFASSDSLMAGVKTSESELIKVLTDASGFEVNLSA